MSDYPKLMVRAGVEITVQTSAEQGDREANGWQALDGTRVAPLDVAHPDEAADGVVDVMPTFGPSDEGTGEAPTEGPSDDDTHVKRSRKKK